MIDQFTGNARHSRLAMFHIDTPLLLGLLALGGPAWAAFWSPRLIFGVILFAACTATAAFAPRRGVVIAALVVVLIYTLWNMVRAGVQLAAAGGWSPSV